jgi:hypothetical protein
MDVGMLNETLDFYPLFVVCSVFLVLLIILACEISDNRRRLRQPTAEPRVPTAEPQTPTAEVPTTISHPDLRMALRYACAGGLTEIVRQLLAVPHTRVIHPNVCALIQTASSRNAKNVIGRTEIVRQLIDLPSDYCLHPERLELLRFASENGDVDIFRMLIPVAE